MAERKYLINYKEHFDGYRQIKKHITSDVENWINTVEKFRDKKEGLQIVNIFEITKGGE